MASARSRSTKILRERVIPTPYDCVRACRRETRARIYYLAEYRVEENALRFAERATMALKIFKFLTRLSSRVRKYVMRRVVEVEMISR